MTRVHDLLELPSAIRKADYVQGLAAGIENADRTVRSYAITPSLLNTYRHALSVIRSALETGRSQAVWLHGSFGSGKSHFMAILDLMVAGHAAPWKRREFHPLREENPWVGDKKLLQLPLHMMGATGLEDAIFAAYVEHVRAQHPDAPLPALFADRELFANAQTTRQRVDDAAFFAALNEGKVAADGWGDFGDAGTWDAARFEAAIAGDDEAERRALFSDLVRSWFPAFAGTTDRFVAIDRGLAELSRHASELGYDGVLLYLDEVVLWLRTRLSDLPFVEREIQKLVKLTEAQDEHRAVPVVSFLARQREIGKWLAEGIQGDDRAAVEELLEHNSGRFEPITLADSNLAAIVEHRVVRARDGAAREQLAGGFARVWRSAQAARGTLVGSEGDEDAFRQVFPFSPALVEALVALSGCLQRERTAIRILMELLVEHLPDLELGHVVPVGDAFDVIAGGEDPLDGVLAARWDRARTLYTNEFLPIIQGDHGTTTAEACQRLRPEHPRKLGCSGCAQTACRNDNRLAKTLLLAALVPQAKPFAGLSVKKLVHLNHGTIASPIPGTEYGIAANKLRSWGARIGPLRVGDEADPELSLRLEGIDLKPILERARSEYESTGTSRQGLRELLYKALIDPKAKASPTSVDFTHRHLGVRRPGRVHFGNVRELADEQLRCPDGAEWQLVVDYPFDQSGHGPEDDLARLESFAAAHPGSTEPTLVWLPTFLSHRGDQTLADYVALAHILDPANTNRYLSHLSPDNQQLAKEDLRSLCSQKKALLERALVRAYGLTTVKDDPLLDGSRTVDDHYRALAAGLTIGGLLVSNLKQGFEQLVERVLEHRYPHHPRFQGPVTSQKLAKLQGLVQRLIERADHRMAIEASDRRDLQEIADPLGLTQTSEAATVLREQTFKELDQRRQQAGLDSPTAGDVRAWTDPQGHRGLTQEIADLLVVLYAEWAGRSLQRGGKAFAAGKLGTLPSDVELVRPDLPDESTWAAALDRAGRLFGVTFAGRHLSARNLATLNDKLVEAAARHDAAKALPGLLATRLSAWGRASAGADRAATAASARQAVLAVEQHDGAEQIRQFVAVALETSETAVARSLSSSATNLAALQAEARWSLFTAVMELRKDPVRAESARQILDDLAQLLETDEVNGALRPGLDDLVARADALLRGGPTEPGWRTHRTASQQVDGPAGWPEALAQLAAELERLAADRPPGSVRLKVGATIEIKPDSDS